MVAGKVSAKVSLAWLPAISLAELMPDFVAHLQGPTPQSPTA
jgi:hypothetical protein